jgi:hypothetical protein
MLLNMGVTSSDAGFEFPAFPLRFKISIVRRCHQTGEQRLPPRPFQFIITLYYVKFEESNINFTSKEK